MLFGTPLQIQSGREPAHGNRLNSFGIPAQPEV
jgi:hypothetical protein